MISIDDHNKTNKDNRITENNKIRCQNKNIIIMLKT